MAPCSNSGAYAQDAVEIMSSGAGLVYAAGGLLSLSAFGLMHQCEFGKECQQLNDLASGIDFPQHRLALENDRYVISGAGYDLVRRQTSVIARSSRCLSWLMTAVG